MQKLMLAADFKTTNFSLFNTSVVSLFPLLFVNKNLVRLHAVQELEGFNVPVLLLTPGFMV